jgi:hypothetical protein
MKAAEKHLLIFEGASAGQHVAAGAAWVDLLKANPSGRASRERASQYPQRSRPSKQRHNDERREPRRSLRSSPKDETVGRRRGKNRQMASALRVAEITGLGCVGFVVTAHCGDAPAKPPCPRPILSATASMRFNQRFPSSQPPFASRARPCRDPGSNGTLRRGIRDS